MDSAAMGHIHSGVMVSGVGVSDHGPWASLTGKLEQS